MTSDLLRWCEARRGRARHDRALVRRSNPRAPTRPRSIAAVTTSIAARLRSAPRSRPIDAAASAAITCARIRAAIGAAVLLLGHFDTVWPVGQLADAVREEDGRLHGPGVFDMKAGIAVAMLARRAARAAIRPRPRVVMLWTTDEEIGSETSRARSSGGGGGARGARARAVAAGRRGEDQPQGLRRVRARRARHRRARRASIRRKGRARSTSSRGRSSISGAAGSGARRISVNVGAIAGGSRPTSSPNGACRDRRARSDDGGRGRDRRRVRGCARRWRGTRWSHRRRRPAAARTRTARVVRLYEPAQAPGGLARSRPRGRGRPAAAPDGNFTAALGVPTLDGLGPRGDGAHALHEHVDLRRSYPGARRFSAWLLRRIGE